MSWNGRPERHRLHAWSGEFVDGTMERRFARHRLRSTRGELRLALLVVAFIFPAFGFSDVVLLGADHPALWALFAVRLVVTLGALWLWWGITTRPALVLRTGPLNAWVFVAVAAIIAIVLLRDAYFGTQLPAVIVAVIAIYLFIPNRMAWRLLHAGVLSLGFLLAVARLPEGPPLFTQTLLLAVVNLVGYLNARRLARLSREQFFLLWDARRANRVLLAEIGERERVEADLDYMVNHDELTALPNRRHFFERAAGRLAEAGRHPVSLLMIDIDHFKRVNDDHGHAVGDVVLAEVARRLAARMGERDLLARLGGEEFAVLLDGCDAACAMRCAEALRGAVLAEPLETAAGPIEVDITVGLTAYRPGQDTVDTALARADEGLYDGKRAGRGTVRMAPRDGTGPG